MGYIIHIFQCTRNIFTTVAGFALIIQMIYITQEDAMLRLRKNTYWNNRYYFK